MRLQELRKWQKGQINVLQRLNGFVSYCMTNGYEPKALKISGNLFDELINVVSKTTQIKTKENLDNIKLQFYGCTCIVNVDRNLPDGLIWAHKED